MEEKEYIEKRVEEILEDILKDSDFVLVDVDFKGAGGRRILQIALDRKEGNITLSDCEKISREISLILDAEDFIEGSYILEVTSPGLNRVLKKEREILWARGKKVILYTDNGEIKGRLKEVDEQYFILEGGKKVERSKVLKIKLNEV